MNRELPGAGFAIAMMLTVVMAVWLGVAGPLDLSKLEKWQTLIAALVALAGGWFAWLGVRAKLEIDWLLREEDRILNQIRGLIDATDFLGGFVFAPALRYSYENWVVELEMLGLEAKRLYPALKLQSILPTTERTVIQEIAQVLRPVLITIEYLRRAEEKAAPADQHDAGVAAARHQLDRAIARMISLRFNFDNQRAILDFRLQDIRARIYRTLDRT